MRSKTSKIFIFSALAYQFFSAPVLSQTLPQVQSGTIAKENKLGAEIDKTPISGFKINKQSTNNENLQNSQKFFVKGYIFEGNKVFSNSQLNAALKDSYNKELTLGQLYQVADRITKLYSDNGYAFSFALIPIQNVNNGFVKIVIIEGKVSSVNVIIKNNTMVPTNEVKALVEKNFAPLLTDKPVMNADLEKAALLTRDQLGQNSKVIVSPAKDKSGYAILNVEVSIDRFDANIHYDDYIRSEFGKNRYGIDLKTRTLILAGDKAGVNYRLSDEGKSFRFISGYYEFLLYRPDLSLNLSASDAKTIANNGLLGLLEFNGSEKTNSAALKWSRVRTRDFSHFLSLNLDATESTSGILGVKLIHDKVRNLDINSDWSWWLENGAQIDAGITLSVGINGLGATQADDPQRSRTTADPDFTALKGYLDMTKPFFGGHLIASNFSEFQLGSGVGAFASRECSFGGESYGFAYNAGVFGGESCLKTKLRIDAPFRYQKLGFSPFVIGEYGWATQSGSLDYFESRSTEGGSYGAGIDISFGKYFYGEIITGKPTNEMYSINGKDKYTTKFRLGIKLN